MNKMIRVCTRVSVSVVLTYSLTLSSPHPRPHTECIFIILLTEPKSASATMPAPLLLSQITASALCQGGESYLPIARRPCYQGWPQERGRPADRGISLLPLFPRRLKTTGAGIRRTLKPLPPCKNIGTEYFLFLFWTHRNGILLTQIQRY